MRPIPIAALLLALPALAAAQGSTPKLDKTQRATLERLVSAVDRASAGDESDTMPAEWQAHVLRASDGSHYVAISATPAIGAAGTLPPGEAAIYVRLATRFDTPPVTAERSAVGEWLRGLRSDPLPARPARIVTVPLGELPVGGPSITMDGTGASQAFAALALQDKQRERARAEAERREKERQAALEGKETDSHRPRENIFPFEDFSMHAGLDELPDGTPVLRRAIVAGPGTYDLLMAVAEPSQGKRPGAIRLFRRPLSLPPAGTSTFALSDIILADAVAPLAAVYPPDQQTAHPYAIGALEVTPARDDVFTAEERLALAVQIINARPAETGKPDVAVATRILRVTPGGDRQVASLTPQAYNGATLPVDFDLAKGHPLFAATAFPLRTLARGDYRLQVTATDRAAGATASGSATFRVAGTPRSLLGEAPPGPAFVRETALVPEILDRVVAALRPASPSAGLQRLLDSAASGRFIEALRDEPVESGEEGVRVALRGLALLAVADSRAATAQAARAERLGVPAAPMQLIVGACRALEGQDREAVAAWQAARAAGLDAPALRLLMAEAHLRLRAGASALPLLGDPTGIDDQTATASGHSPRATLALAGALVQAGREDEAVAVLDAHLDSAPQDETAAFLRLQALYSGHVHGRGVGATAGGRERLTRLGTTYADRDGPHAALVREWLAVVSAATPSAS